MNSNKITLSILGWLIGENIVYFGKRFTLRAFIYLFNTHTHMLSGVYVPDTVLGAGDTGEFKADKNLCPHELTFQSGGIRETNQ